MEQTNVDAPVVATEEEFTLADYRAGREPKADPDPKVDPKAAKPAAAAPLEPGDPDVGDDGDGDTPNDTPENAAKKKKLGGFQKTIARQAAEIEALKRGTPAAAAAAAAAPAAPAPKPAAKPAAEPVYNVPKPDLAECDGIEDFTEKLFAWKADEREFLNTARTQRAQDAADVAKLAHNWNAAKVVFISEHPDWNEVMAAVADIELSVQHQEILLDSPHGVELAYALAQDRDELERIAKLSPLAAAREIGKLEASYGPKGTVSADDDDDDEQAKTIRVSQAPAPFKPVNGNNARVKPNIANMTVAEYRKAVEAGRI